MIIVESSPATAWAPVLRDNYEIASYIEGLASDYVDVEMMEERFNGYKAVLKELPLGDAVEGDPDGNVRSAKRERKFARMDASTQPPIVIMPSKGGMKVVDGNHRLRVSRQRGDTTILAYVCEEE